jgi:hypothetical protein
MGTPLDATSTIIPAENLVDWKGQDVVDPDSQKIGKLEDLYYDGETDAPAFLTVKGGLVKKRLTLIPLAGASVGRDFVRVRPTKKQVGDAPSFDPDEELSADDEAAAYRFYGVPYAPAGQGARRLAKR